MHRSARTVAAALAFAVLPALAHAGADADARGPRLGAATDFGQTWAPALMEAVGRLAPLTIRDEIFWANVENAAGAFVFDNRRSTYPDLLPAHDARLMFLVNNPHPAHDGGTTPHTETGVQAFARYVTTTLARFPRIGTVEVGNEMNSDTFAWGPGWDGPLPERAASYVRLLAATAEAVRAVRPQAEIIGGAAHSIPIAWFREIFARGAARWLDALAIHPYTVAPEQLARQIALLRAEVPEAAMLPLAVTEFGTPDESAAPGYLLKSYCQQAISGVEWSVWYPLNARGDGLAPLLADDGGLTPAGQMFRFIQETFEGRVVTDASPDPFAFGCRFDAGWLVLWGEPREIALAPGVEVVDPARGTRHGARFLTLSPGMPLVLHAVEGAIDVDTQVHLGPAHILADSWLQFAYPGAGGPPDPFERLARRGGREAPLEMRPGQERGGVPWTPYLGSDIDGEVRASAEWVLPSGTLADPVEIVYRWRAPAAGTIWPEVRLNPWEGGVRLSVTLDGQPLRAPEDAVAGTLTLPLVTVAKGAVLDVIAGPNGSGGGADLRVILRDAPPAAQ